MHSPLTSLLSALTSHLSPVSPHPPQHVCVFACVVVCFLLACLLILKINGIHTYRAHTQAMIDVPAFSEALGIDSLVSPTACNPTLLAGPCTYALTNYLDSGYVCHQPPANTCTCANGVAKTGSDCTTDGASMCASCAQGYTKNAAGTACEGLDVCIPA